MRPQTEEFLNLLLWSADKLMRPTFRNLDESYESWAYRHGLMRQVASLEKRQMLERDHASPKDRIYRLTYAGWLHAIGGRDPIKCWNRKWDGQWRLVLFDLPNRKQTHRDRLRYYLRSQGFGYLQKSVWISPHPLSQERQILKDGEINVESLLLIEGRPASGESNGDIVDGAWDFHEINRLYSRHLKLLEQPPQAEKHSREWSEKALLAWASTERKAWLKAMAADPLLPQPLLPPGYLGKESWQRRTEIFKELHHLLALLGPT